MESKLKNWKRPPISKFGGFLLLGCGLITFVAGFGAWKHPHLDWKIFTESFITLLIIMRDETIRMFNDPFAFIGLLMMIAGFIATISGMRKLSSKPGDFDF